MVKLPKDNSTDTKPAEFRRSVSGPNQFQLPAVLVREVGFESSVVDTTSGAKVAWYYHEGEQKAVLAHKEIDHPALAFQGTSSLTNISNEDLASGDVSGAKVTIVTDLPERLHEQLTRDAVVLKPIYEEAHAGLDWTCVAVYPAAEFDNGTLPNVRREQTDQDTLDDEYDEDTGVIGEYHSHANSI